MNCTCNKCNEEFEIKPRIKKYADAVEETFFTCPHCNERYSSFFTNNDIRKKQKLLKNRYTEIAREVIKENKIKLISEYKAMQQDLVLDMENLKRKMLK